MAIKLEKKTSRDRLLKLVSVEDGAIDWPASYPGEDLSDDEKKERYDEDHDLAKLVFVETDKPTLFVFDHPARVDVARKIRGLYAKTITSKAQADLFTEIWDQAFVGTEEGVDGGALQAPQRRNGRMTEDFLQALEDTGGIFQELARAFLSEATRAKDAEKAAAKK